MFRLDRLGLLVLICLVSGIALSLFFGAVGVQAKQPINQNSLLLTPTAEPSSPGQPCGSGQQLPPNIICLYGTVSQQSASGVITPLNGVLVTITLGSQSVTDTTFVHPGNNTPTYGIDIHFLNPQFLQPVTLTAVVDNMLISRQVIVFPDFQTMSQRYDLVVPPVASLPQGLWGYVVDFASGGPVAGAVITAKHGGQFITATTIVPDPGNDPYYQLDPSTIASPGEQIIITATFNGETEQKSLTLPSTLPVQINFVTGWHCDDFNPLPGTTGPGGLPGTTGPGGLPDVACFWGYVFAEGRPVAGANVHLVISGTIYSAETALIPGETLSRYSIGTWGGQSIAGSTITATAVYSGHSATEEITVTLDNNLSQRIDYSLAEVGVLANHMNGNLIQTLVWDENALWAGTIGGLVRWNTSDGSFIKFTTADGLISNNVQTTVLAEDNSLWLGTDKGISHYIPQTGVWEDLIIPGNALNNDVNAVAVDPTDGSVWFGTHMGASHYVPTTGSWITFTTANSELAHDWVFSVAMQPDGTVWFGTDGGLSKYSSTTSQWQTFAVGAVNVVRIGMDNSLWIGTTQGLSHYTPGGSPEWETFTTSNSGLGHNTILSIASATDGSLWFGTLYGVSHYVANGNPSWRTFLTIPGMHYHSANSLAVANDNSLWVGTLSGVTHYTPMANPEWENFVIQDTLFSTSITSIGTADDGSTWFGADTTSPKNFYSGASHYDLTGNPLWERFHVGNSGLAGDSIRATVVDFDGSIWFGTDNGLSHFTPGGNPEWETFNTGNSGLPANSIRSLALAGDGSLWIGTFSRGVAHYNPNSTPEWEVFDTANSGLGSNNIRAIAVGKDGSLWFGTDTSGTGNGVDHYIPGSTTTWEKFTTNNSGLINNDIFSILVDTDGSLWFGTYEGLSHYMVGSNPEWESFTVVDGLIANYINSLALGTDQSLWIGTGFGVSHYIPGGSPEWETFTTEQGLAHNQVRVISVASDGAIWIGTYGGVSQWRATSQYPDLSVQLSGTTVVTPSSQINYSIAVSNFGQRYAPSTYLTITLPLSMSFESASIPPLTTTSPLVWELGTLPASQYPFTLVLTTSLSSNPTPGTILSTIAEVVTSLPEPFAENNDAEWSTQVLDPYRSDLRVTASGPPILVPGGQAHYNLYLDNIGGLAAATSTLTATLPAELEFLSASIPPVTISPLIWDFGTLPPLSPLTPLIITAQVASNTPPGVNLTVYAAITTTTPDSNPNNNSANVTIATSLSDARTLFLVAPDRLASRYGASPLMGELYQLAQHPLVEGAILDVTGEPAVAAAYTAWDADPGNWQRANEVAEAIKTLIDQYTIAYPNLQYLVIVGGDEIIPFYRLADQNSTVWQEDDYAPYLRPSTVQSALASNRLLTDDFYADRLPTTVNSPFWFDGHPLYIPDFALGRLVETPEEIMAVIDAFLTNNGIITLGPGLVGTLSELTDDLGDQQCDLLQNAGLGHLCTHSSQIWKDALLNDLFGSFWLTVHGNHFSMGSLYAHELPNANASYNNTFLANLSCHGGLNDPQPIGNNWPDLPQAFLGQGGSYLGSTAYTYASWFGVQYSEAIAAAFLENLLVANPPTLGQALVQTKQDYYATYGYLFTYLDEKVLVPTTFYGLPMLQVDTTPLNLVAPLVNPSLPPAYQPNEGIITLPFTRNNLTYDLHTLPDGQYYSYQGQIQTTHYRPVQPQDHEELPADINGAYPHGFTLMQATFSEETNFDPRIAESWILGSSGSLPIEPSVTLSGWDHPFPVYMTQFTGLLATQASLNFILGAYDADRGVERLYENLVGEVLYSDSPDWTPPTLISQVAYTTPNRLIIEVQAHDDSGMAQVVALCADGQGTWTGVNLTRQGQTWQGSCPVQTTQFMAQLVDAAANVTRTPWQIPSGPAIFTLYLPVALQP